MAGDYCFDMGKETILVFRNILKYHCQNKPIQCNTYLVLIGSILLHFTASQSTIDPSALFWQSTSREGLCQSLLVFPTS